MKQKSVLIKGMLGGLRVEIGHDVQLSMIKEVLREKVRNNGHFFEGATVNMLFTGRELTEEEKQELKDFISHEIKLGSLEFKTGLQEHGCKSGGPCAFDGLEEGITRFVRGTVRNGQRIDYKGNVVVLGDVNPGGEIIASGNIIVLGALRGMAHAGADGNDNAVVVAYRLLPTQLRIGSIITRPPEGDSINPSYPEIAYVKDNNLVIEPSVSSRLR